MSQPADDIDQALIEKSLRTINDHALDVVFRQGRSANGFHPTPVPRELLDRMVQLALLGPTSANSLPMRVLFLESEAAKARLLPALAPNNVPKATQAAAVAIVAADSEFYRHLPRTFPHRDMTWRFDGTERTKSVADQVAWDNTLFQFAYLIVAARSLGLDAGPIEGFDRAAVDAEFFPDHRLRTTYLINLGYGDDTKVFQRLPRFDVHEIVTYL